MVTTSEKIFILTPKGDQFAVAFDPADTLVDLKAKIEAECGTPAVDQRVAFGGKTIEEGHALSDYNISKESTLHLGVRVEGGLFGTILFAAWAGYTTYEIVVDTRRNGRGCTVF